MKLIIKEEEKEEDREKNHSKEVKRKRK